MTHPLALGLTLLLAAAPALAAPQGGNSITVTTAADELNTNGLCSLREAITNANNNNQSGSQDCGPGGDPETIFLPAGNYALSIAGTGDDLNVSGDLDILGRVTLIGSGMQATVVDGQQLDRVFHVMNGLVTFRDFTIQGGSSSNVTANRTAGGILSVSGDALVLDHVRVTGNTVTVGGSLVFGAGGVYVSGALELLKSQVDHNTATLTTNIGVLAGGVSCSACTISEATIGDNTAIATSTTQPGPLVVGGLDHCTLSLTRSRIHGNQVTATGLTSGGISSGCGGITVDISRTLFDGNSVTMTGTMGSAAGAINVGGGGSTYNLANVTVVDNVVHTGSIANAFAGGGLLSGGGGTSFNLRHGSFSGNRTDGATTSTWALRGDSGQFKVANSLFDGDTCSSTNTVQSLGGNLEGPGSTCGLTQASDQSAVAVRGVGTLADNGGSTLTLALAPTSPAVDHGDNSVCEVLDQRGVTRPLDGDGDGTATCDVGAFEYSDVLFASGFQLTGA